MKTYRARSCSALTLGEVMVVLTLVVILAILFFPTTTHGPPARRQKAATVVRGVVNACDSYKEDYGYYPQIAAARDGTAANPYLSFGDQANAHCKAGNRALLDVLRAIERGENKGHVLNSKQVKYYEGPKAIDSRTPRGGSADGPEFSPAIQGEILDPWGTPYCFLLETDKDEILDLSAFYSDLAGPDEALHFGATGFSLGKDGMLGGRGYEGKLRKPDSTEGPDDVVSWQ